MGQLDGKGVVVTGGSRGIGRAIVQRLAADGAAVLFSFARRRGRVPGRPGRALDHRRDHPRDRRPGVTTRERTELRTTFDSAAGLYQDARPEYPAVLFDELIALTGASPARRLLEVGCATGKATLPLARRGLRITCLELGAGLAAAARRNLAGFPAVDVVTADFETWAPAAAGAAGDGGAAAEGFDLIVAANCWHWIDPAIRYRRARELLRPGGQLAIFDQTHVFPDGGDPFFAEIQDVYDEIGEGMPPGQGRPRPGELPDLRADIEASGLFGDVAVRHFDWEVRYDADGYLRLLDTFSNHVAMSPAQRGRLYGEIRRRLAERPDGMLRRGWGSVLQVASLLED